MKLDIFLSSITGLRFDLSEGPKRVGVPFSTPEDRNRSNFQNVVFPKYLEYRIMGQTPETQ
jgi:hypothetical protein